MFRRSPDFEKAEAQLQKDFPAMITKAEFTLKLSTTRLDECKKMNKADTGAC